MNILWWIYAVVLVCGLTGFFLYIRRIRRGLKEVGENRKMWISHLLFSFPANIPAIAVFAAYLIYSLYIIFFRGKYNLGFAGLLLFSLLLLFLARYHVAAGEKGILFRGRFIPWEKISGVNMKPGTVNWMKVTWKPDSPAEGMRTKKWIVPNRLYRPLSLMVSKRLLLKKL